MRRSRALALIAALVAIAAGYAGVRWGVLLAGGSDSYGYVSQAGLWRHGLPIVQQDIVRQSPWPGAAETWAPLAYRPSPHVPAAIVPVYAPGLPLLMAALQLVAGYCGAFLVVPLSGALTIWLTFVLGRRLFDAPGVALWGALLVATSPVFLYQLMNAMSDVPVTAAWMLALVFAVMRRPLASGLAMTATIAIRPNLAPLAAVLGLWMARAGTAKAVPYTAGNLDSSPQGGVVRHRLSDVVRHRSSDVVGHRFSGAWKDVLGFAIGVAPSVAGIAWFNAQLYESAATSGYGTTGDLYSLAFLTTNLRQFVVWIVETQTPIVALAALYFVVPRLFPPARVSHARLLLGGSLAVVVLSYLFYQPFDTWWYLRFLLPMWPAMMLLTALAVDAIAQRWTGRAYQVVIGSLVVLLAWHGVTTARARRAFDLGRGERRYVDLGRFVAAHTDPGAVMFSVQHSGSLRLYAGRMTLRFDALDPLWLDRTVEYLQSIGRRPYFVLDGAEVDVFKTRFAAANKAGSLDWPPMAMLGTTIAIYDPLDRRPGAPPLAITSTRGALRGRLCDPPYTPTGGPLDPP